MSDFEVIFCGRDFYIVQTGLGKPIWLSEDDRLFQELRKAESSKPALPPLPAGATRHKALPAACLTLPDAACFMKGMR